MLGGQQGDATFPCYCTEGAAVEGQHPAPANALGAGDHARVGEAQSEVGVASHQLTDAGQILLAALQRKPTFFEVQDEPFKHGHTEAAFGQVRDLRQYAGGNQIRTRILEQSDSAGFA
jgi:hypothetical protein